MQDGNVEISADQQAQAHCRRSPRYGAALGESGGMRVLPYVRNSDRRDQHAGRRQGGSDADISFSKQRLSAGRFKVPKVVQESQRVGGSTSSTVWRYQSAICRWWAATTRSMAAKSCAGCSRDLLRVGGR